MDIVYFLLIGIVAGWLAGQLWKGRGFGPIGNLVIGVIGSFLGGFVIRLFGLYAGGLLGQLITATLGALILLFIAGQLKKA